MSKAVVVFSGGQDSTTCLYWSKNRFDSIIAISFFYGQKHSRELEQAKKIAQMANIEHHIIDISFFGDIVDSALTHNGDVTKSHNRLKNLPASFVPNRNAMFLTIAHAFAQKIGAEALVTGVCQTDFSGYPDCRDEFIKTINKALNIGSDTNLKIITPLMWLNKAQTWDLAEKEGCIDIVKTYSYTCYNGSEKMNDWGYGCGECPACNLRKKGWGEYVQSKKKN